MSETDLTRKEALIVCPRCSELRGKAVMMNTVRKGEIAQAYECPSCDYVVPLVKYP